MRIQFYLRFHTQPGQSLFVTGNLYALGNNDPSRALAAVYMDSEYWHATIELEGVPMEPVRYRYILRNEDGTLTYEGGDDRELEAGGHRQEEIQVFDTWNYAGEYENVFYTAPFRGVLLARTGKRGKSRQPGTYTHIFKVKAPLLKKDEIVCLSGSGQALGDWEQKEPLKLSPNGNWWSCRVTIPKESFPIAYKYGIYDSKNKTFRHFENGPNRQLHGDALQHTLTVLHDGFIHLPNNTWRGAGVAIPVFALRTRKSFGVGEFSDCKKLVDWAKKSGLSLIQILPVNDTTATYTWQDSYPYAAISAFALHPLYLDLAACAGKKHAALLKPLRKKQQELNDLPEMDYEEVMRVKRSVAGELYELQKDEFLKSASFRAFFEDNKHWLVPYAAFCILRDKNGTPDFSKWRTHSVYDADAIQKYVSPRNRHYDSIALQYFIQYHLHEQLRSATDYAHEQGVPLKGDIPIGIYRYSCDAWMEPALYNMDFQAGAPPDDFAVKGQNWGFPTYNWSQMERDGYSWWKKRFSQMRNYFDAFRIDHILGFFRIWSIPVHAVEGILGYFVPAIPVHRNEFNDRNIWFDYDRYARPFINDAVLWEVFGHDSQTIADTYLDRRDDGQYTLKPAFDTQRKVEAYFAARDKTDFSDRSRQGLYDLIANILLIDAGDPPGSSFHFRISMENSSSFRFLEWNTQQQLKDLYLDYFFRRQDYFWRNEALKKLPPLKRATNMLVFGEDLGMVPGCVPEVMRQLGILSLEVQRMPKDPGLEFANPASAPYLAAITPSTHDMSTIRGWWEEDRAKTQQFFNHELGQWGEAPYFCEPWINKAIVLQHLHSPALWAIFQLQDILGMSDKFRRENPHDERINIPANPHHYWRYRMHLTLEELLRHRHFNEELREQVEAAGR